MFAAAQAAASVAAPAPLDPAVMVTQPATVAPQAVLPKGTMVRLMVLNEVNSRDHAAGHRFVLRVDEEVRAGATTIIPIGAQAWGEVVDARATGGAGRSGKLNARLLYVDTGGRQVKLDGERHAAGNGSTGQVVASVVAFGPLGLLMKGNNAKLKAGEILNGYTLEDQVFDLPSP